MSKENMRKRLRDKYKSPKVDIPQDKVIDPKIRAVCEEERLDIGDWCIYFGDVDPRRATCKDCYEYRNGLCAGGKEPIRCLRDERRAEMRLRSSR